MLQCRFPISNMLVLPVGPIEPFDWDEAPNCLGDASNAGVAFTLYNTLLTAMLSTALQYVLSQLTCNVSLQTGPLLLLQCHSSLPGHLHGHRSALPSAALLHHIRACQAHQSSWTTCRQGNANQVGLHDVNLCAKPCIFAVPYSWPPFYSACLCSHRGSVTSELSLSAHQRTHISFSAREHHQYAGL